MLFDSNEYNRLKRAFDKNNKIAIMEWGRQFEASISQELSKAYEKQFQEDLGNSIDTFCLCIAFVLHNSETCKIDNKDIPEFMEDLFATVNMFSRGDYNPEDYESMLKDDGIYLDEFRFTNKYNITNTLEDNDEQSK